MSLAQLSQLLPLPSEDLQQVLDYAATLSKPDAATHFSNLLGDSPLAVDFIAAFNSHRKGPAETAPSGSGSGGSGAATPTTSDAVPKAKRHTKKPKPNIHTPQPRKVEDYPALAGTAYKKDDTFEYIPQRASAPTSNHASRSTTPKPPQLQQQPKQHASSAGSLISDALSKSKAKSTPVSRSSTPKPSASGNATKISIAGGTPMAGQSTALADLDAAIRALEISTNPSLDDTAARKCNCVATRHPLQGAAPNCLSCGKVICMKQGLGPCTFCGTPLLKPDEVQAMVRELKDERGRERMAANAGSHRRAEVSKTPAPFTQARGNDDTGSGTLAEAEARAREHRDRLLGFQAQNARRTTVRDEAADFDVTGAMAGSGGSMWASPEERARELKRQQKLMREMEWNAKPEYEKRRQVVSIDLVGKKVVRKMADVVRPPSPEDTAEVADEPAPLRETTGNRSGGAFSGNPLLGAVIKPVFDAKGKGPEEGRRERKTGWRRVQDDMDDNEGVILDGGVYGHGRGDEPDCG